MKDYVRLEMAAAAAHRTLMVHSVSNGEGVKLSEGGAEKTRNQEVASK